MKICAIIVTHNRLSLLKEVIEAVKSQTNSNISILVINNDSNDGTKEWLEDQTDILVINQLNLGGAGGFFTGMKYACHNCYDYVWIMDDDVIPNTNALDALLKPVILGVDFGFVCSKVIDLYGNPMNVPLIDDSKSNTGYQLWGENIEHGLVRIRNATFVSLLIPVKNIFTYGLPYKDFFIWGDDTEYTIRLSSKLPCYLVGNSVVVHKRENRESLSIFTEKDIKRIKMYFYMFRNHMFMAKSKILGGDLFALKYYLYYLFLIFKLFFSFKFAKCNVLVKAFISSFLFSPIIEFPK